MVHNAKDASKTFPGIAKAMAEQWGNNDGLSVKEQNNDKENKSSKKV